MLVTKELQLLELVILEGSKLLGSSFLFFSASFFFPIIIIIITLFITHHIASFIYINIIVFFSSPLSFFLLGFCFRFSSFCSILYFILGISSSSFLVSFFVSFNYKESFILHSENLFFTYSTCNFEKTRRKKQFERREINYIKQQSRYKLPLRNPKRIKDEECV